MKIVFAEHAARDLDTIGDHIALDSRASARLTLSRIGLEIRRLAQFPLLGRLGVIEGTRELVVRGTFIVVYRVHETEAFIEIVAIVRATQDR